MSEYLNNLYPDGKIRAIGHKFVVERDATKVAFEKSRGLALVLEELAKSGAKPKTPIQTLIHKELAKKSGHLVRLKDKDFEYLYSSLNSYLNKRFIYSTSRQPPSEKIFIRKLKSSLARKIYQSVFIGPYQFDALSMSLRVGTLPGVAFEVNGGCHNREGKMSIDTEKRKFIENVIGVSYLPIEDGDMYRGHYDAIINDFKTRGNVDFRMMKRRWRKIYSETLAHWAYLRGGKAEARKLIKEFLWLKNWKDVESLISRVRNLEP